MCTHALVVTVQLYSDGLGQMFPNRHQYWEVGPRGWSYVTCIGDLFSDTHYVDCNLPYQIYCQYCEQYSVISTFMFQWPSQSFLLVEIIQQWVCNMFILTLSTTNLKIKNWSSLFFIRVCLITTDCVWNKRVFARNSDSVKKLLWKAEISDVISSSLK